MWACAGGHAAVVKLLLSNGADTSKRKNDGKCAADVAAFKKHRQVTLLYSVECLFVMITVDNEQSC